MSSNLTRRLTPEEQELEKKRRELVALEAELADRELGLATMKKSSRHPLDELRLSSRKSQSQRIGVEQYYIIITLILIDLISCISMQPLRT